MSYNEFYIFLQSNTEVMLQITFPPPSNEVLSIALLLIVMSGFFFFFCQHQTQHPINA